MAAEFTASFTLVSQVPIEATFALMAYYQLTSEQLDAINTIIIDGDGTKALFDDGVYKTSYTASQTDAFLALKADKSNTYTITQVNAALALKADTTALIAGLATKQDTLTAGTGIMFIGDTIYATGTAAVYFADILGDPTDNTKLNAILEELDSDISTHIADTNNPHATTADQVGAYTTGETDNLLDGKADLSGATFTDAISATNLSGTNTGDETKETIIEKLDGEFEPKITYPTESPETKYYRGDGTFQEIAIGGGGYAANLYFTTTDSDVSGYKKISYELPATETELPATFSGTQLLRTYLFDAGIDTTLIDAGLWSANFSSKLNSSGGVTSLRGEVFLRHIDNTETTLFSATSPELNNTLEFLVIRIESNQPSFACVATDRLGMRVYGVTNRHPNVTLTTIIGDGRASYFNTPLKLRHSQLRDLNSDSGFLHVTQAEKDEWNASAELFNGKADISAVARLSMPDTTTKTDLTLGASGTEYTAPGTGYILVCKQSSAANQNINMQKKIAGTYTLWDIKWSSGGIQNLVISMPVVAGEKFLISYTTGNATQFFRFVPALGV